MDQTDSASLRKAEQYFKLANQKDPGVGPRLMPELLAWLPIKFKGMSYFPGEGLPKMHKYLEKALELDPNSADAYYQTGRNCSLD